MADYGEREERSDRFTEIEDRFAGYNVYDPQGERIGKVDDVFVNQMDEPEYIGVKMGFLGTRSTLIPWSICTVDEANQRIEAAVDKQKAKDGPTFDDDQEITPEYEEEVHRYYSVEAIATERSAYGAYRPYPDEEERIDTEPGARAEEYREEYREERHPGVAMGDTESGEFQEHPPEAEGVRERESDLEDEDELRVQRTEEVHVDRVPVEGEATEAEIGEDEIRVPVTEEEAVVEKRPVTKEEIRIRKDVVEDKETIEEDVRREEVEVDDETERREG